MNFLLLQVFVIFLSTSFFLPLAHSKNEIKIIEIQRSLSLNNDKQHNKEFYVNAGSRQGVKVKHIVPVVRRKSFYDPLLNKNIGDLWLPVGELKIIHVGKTVSIARIHKVPGRSSLPEVEYNTFMVGDRLRLNKSKLLKRKRKKKSAKRKNSTTNGAQRGIASVNSKDGKPKSQFSFSESLRQQMNKPTATSDGVQSSKNESDRFSNGSVSRQLRVPAR